MDKDPPSTGYDVSSFIDRIMAHAPRAMAFNGKRAAQAYFCRDVANGRQGEMLAGAAVFVLPTTSGAARGSWDEAYWREMAEFIQKY